MTTYEPTEIEGTDLESRTERALTECMTVLPDAPDLFTVVGENGNESYTLLIIGSTANDPTVSGSPTRQLSISLLTIGIMFGIAVVIVTAVRANRKLQG
jgi:hypothetical protein